jgi:hypothetical protein
MTLARLHLTRHPRLKIGNVVMANRHPAFNLPTLISLGAMNRIERGNCEPSR